MHPAENNSDHIRCVLFPIVGATHSMFVKAPMRRTWCGNIVEPFQWCFTDVDHAALNSMAQARLQVCTECAEKISTALVANKYIENTADENLSTK